MKAVSRRRLRVALGILAALALAVAAGLYFATRALKSHVEAALGAEGEVGSITLGISAVELHRVRMPGPKGWPAEDSLRAGRIVIVPDLAGLLSARLRLRRITAEDVCLSVLRQRDGRLRLLPGLLEKPSTPATEDTGMAVTIGTVEITGGSVELYDASVRKPAHKVRLEAIRADVRDIRYPELDGRTRLSIEGRIKGVRRDGTLAIDGWTEIATRNSRIATHLRGVDLLALQPYLIKAAETGVRRGTLDLDIEATVRDNRLHAPGSLTLHGLELAPAAGTLGTFLGVPRQAVIASLKDRKGRIAVRFTLDGDLSDPKFSLNENLAMRVGSSVADTLGISVEGLARDVGNAASGIGAAVRGLFGK